MTTHRQKTLIGGAEPESFGKQIRRGTTLQNRKLLPWLFVGPFLWVHVVHSQRTADTARTSAAVTGNGYAEAKTNDASFFGLTSSGASSVPPNLRPFQLVLPRAHLFGDWDGLRPNLEDRDFTPTLTFVSDGDEATMDLTLHEVAGNVTGAKNQGVSEADNFELDLLFDLEKPNQLQLLNK
jgi:hypothetical protein